MEQDRTGARIREIMGEFAGSTGLEPVSPHPHRYLWTDAFAVCNYLQIFRLTGDSVDRDLVLRLVDQVHHTLGRHREDDPREGWISGLSEQEGRLHPTAGGLRIGKPLAERRLGEPPDERLEWEQDGQYYHYLTKWMHALNRVGRVTRDPVYLRWAIELARSAHAAFTYRPPSGGRKRMYWKMSIDLSRPLVRSMGQHDALDGFVTYSELQAAAARDFSGSPLPGLGTEIADMADICRGGGWVTDDPLGIGGLLFDAVRISQLTIQGSSRYGELLEQVLEAALIGLESFAESGSLHLPAGHRLAFRELGLAIGLAGIGMVQDGIRESPQLHGRRGLLTQQVRALLRYEPLGQAILKSWMDVKNREAGTWTAHREINMVMLATSLAPGEFLSV
jgi:hypothetical protein